MTLVPQLGITCRRTLQAQEYDSGSTTGLHRADPFHGPTLRRSRPATVNLAAYWFHHLLDHKAHHRSEPARLPADQATRVVLMGHRRPAERDRRPVSQRISAESCESSRVPALPGTRLRI